MTRLLGVDLGARRIGLAVADEGSGVAVGLGIMRRGALEDDVAGLARLVRERSIDVFVIGLPRNTDGTEGPQAAVTRAWGEAVARALGLPLRWRDERWTSQDAEAALGRVRRGRSGGPPSPAALRRRRAAVDREAARLILEAELAAGRTAAAVKPAQVAETRAGSAARPADVTAGSDA